MKKKQRCLLKRFATLVAALMLCASLCVPAFASNNASTKKWVVVAEDQRRGENGQLTRYLKVSPYVGGAQYATIVTSQYQFQNVVSGVGDRWVFPINYPDWWRASLPLGNTAYVELSSPTILEAYYKTSSGSVTVADSVYLFPFLKTYALTTSFSRYSSATSFSGSFFCFPFSFYDGHELYSMAYSDGFLLPASGETTFKALYSRNLVPAVSDNINNGFSYRLIDVFSNASSDQIIWCALPGSALNSSNYSFGYARVSVVISYWIDANKLPAGLQVGDEFPADTDAFDQLRDDLIEQFPEAADNIENGKATIQGWNDTETVDTDVASTSIAALNALFQNLGGFLFIISLMVFGAVLLRMLIRKAVDG